MAFHTWKAIKERKGLTKLGVILLDVGLGLGWGLFGLSLSSITEELFLRLGIAACGLGFVEAAAGIVPGLYAFSLNAPSHALKEPAEGVSTPIEVSIASTMRQGDTHEPDPQSLPSQ